MAKITKKQGNKKSHQIRRSHATNLRMSDEEFKNAKVYVKQEGYKSIPDFAREAMAKYPNVHNELNDYQEKVKSLKITVHNYQCEIHDLKQYIDRDSDIIADLRSSLHEAEEACANTQEELENQRLDNYKLLEQVQHLRDQCEIYKDCQRECKEATKRAERPIFTIIFERIKRLFT